MNVGPVPQALQFTVQALYPWRFQSMGQKDEIQRYVDTWIQKFHLQKVALEKMLEFRPKCQDALPLAQADERKQLQKCCW